MTSKPDSKPVLLTASESIRKAIKAHEALRLTAYLCPANKCTIGWGHTKTAKQGQVITLEQAEKLFEADVNEVEVHIRQNVKVPLNQFQHDALVSFIFNVGPYNFIGSTLLKKLNKYDYEGAAGQFTLWDKARIKVDGKKKLVALEGLKIRRMNEKVLFSRGLINVYKAKV